jgi:hypothetical protein
MAAAQAPPSLKVRAWASIPCQINSRGYTYCYVTPCVANNAPCIFTLHDGGQGDGFDGGVPVMSDVVANGDKKTVKHELFNLPYSSDAFTATSVRESTLVGRVIAVSIRVRYTGTNLNMAGQVIAYTRGNNTRVEDRALDAIKSSERCSVSNLTREWVTITTFANQSNTMRYIGYDDSKQSNIGVYGTKNGYIYPWAESTDTMSYEWYDGVSANIDYYPGAPVAVVGIVGGYTRETVEFQVVQHIEYIGPTVSLLTTPSDLDEKGRELVVASVNDMQQCLTGRNQYAKDIGRLLKPSLTRIATAAAPVATSLVMGALGL